ncbi:MAG: ATP-binding protein [Holosporaceae bacterium]|jgi:signal transduction histidine kinase|nr:ATP-binding protein [Holosporaceae bacterium]
MSTERCIKWDKEAVGFFESVEDYAVELTFVVSHKCDSQTGEGFEEFVNSVNSEHIRKKIRKIFIFDASYLYRYCIFSFDKLSDRSIPSIWFSNNKQAISKLLVKTEVVSWVDQINTEEFKKWREKIVADFDGDGNQNGMVLEFRDILNTEAAVSHYKGNGSFEGCRDFLIEETAHACAFLQNTVIVYPMNLARSLLYATDRYGTNIKHLRYKISPQAQSGYKCRVYDREKIDKEVSAFMREKVSNVNFFVVDKRGEYIYKNTAFSKIVGNINAEELDPKSWENSKEVIDSGEQVIVEEEYEGTSYLSVKSPLVIDGEIEGVIGLAVNDTDRKKAAELQIKNKEQETKIREQKEFKAFTAQVMHDISSPLACLEFIAKSPDIPDSCQGMLKSMASSIRNICGTLQAKYREYEKLSNSSQSANIFPSLVLDEIVKNKKFEYRDSKVKFDFLSKTNDMHISIIADQLGFERMISNLINNAVDACAKDSGVVEISFSLENEWAKIIIKDNGIGMPKEIIEKIKSRSTNFNSTKHSGYGLGLSQILAEISRYKGILDIESKENSGTTFSIKFPVVECPEWIAKQLTFEKGNVVVVLDDDPSVFKILEELFKNYSSDNDLTLRFFTKSKDTLDFIKSFPEKEKLFFISDYELRGDDFNGLTVILQSDLAKDRVCVLTGHSDKNLQDMAESSGVKILLKQFLSNVSIVVT